jgi:micrococcal nuclease
MRKYVLISTLFLAVGIAIGSALFAHSEEGLIPSWIKNTAKFWVEGKISDKEFLGAIQYLIDKKILTVSEQTTQQPKLSCLGNGLCISARVEKIVDGDTIYIEGYKVRLSLTNTPETNEAGFAQASEFTRKLCPIGSTIVVDQDDMQPYDAYGRLLGKVYCDGKLLNAELLYNGHANILTQYCSTSEFSGETWAKKYGCETKTPEVKQQAPTESQSPTSTPTAPTPTTPQPSTPTKENKCDPSYPDVCIPPYPPDLDCGEISYRNFKVLPPDPHRFDGDKDGIGCES